MRFTAPRCSPILFAIVAPRLGLFQFYMGHENFSTCLFTFHFYQLFIWLFWVRVRVGMFPPIIFYTILFPLPSVLILPGLLERIYRLVHLLGERWIELEPVT